MKRALAACVVLAFVLTATAWAENLTVSFLDVGQGDAILIRSPEGKVALVDAGPSVGILDILKQEGVDKIDVLVASHHHADHIGGVVAVVEKYKPKVYVDSGSSQTSSIYKRVLKAVNDAGCQFAQPKKDSERKIELGSVTLRLFPQPPEDENENNNSVGIRLEYGEFSALLTGDSQEKERGWWLKNADGTLYGVVIVMKAAHHGSHNGMDLTWLKATKPQLAVISCGKGNSYGHPHQATLDLMKGQEVPIKRTDVDGTIRIESDGRTWKVRAKEDHASIRHEPLRLAA
jgi:beta-lactamase superfamily II metal-dependent hydrolase